MKVLLLLPLIALTGCAGTSPYGSAMLGTNASKMVIKGNAKTGEYIFYAEDLNQSDSFGKAADVVRVVKQTEAMVDLSKSAVTEAGSVVDTVIQ